MTDTSNTRRLRHRKKEKVNSDGRTLAERIVSQRETAAKEAQFFPTTTRAGKEDVSGGSNAIERREDGKEEKQQEENRTETVSSVSVRSVEEPQPTNNNNYNNNNNNNKRNHKQNNKENGDVDGASGGGVGGASVGTGVSDGGGGRGGGGGGGGGAAAPAHDSYDGEFAAFCREPCPLEDKKCPIHSSQQSQRQPIRGSSPTIVDNTPRHNQPHSTNSLSATSLPPLPSSASLLASAAAAESSHTNSTPGKVRQNSGREYSGREGRGGNNVGDIEGRKPRERKSRESAEKGRVGGEIGGAGAGADSNIWNYSSKAETLGNNFENSHRTSINSRVDSSVNPLQNFSPGINSSVGNNNIPGRENQFDPSKDLTILSETEQRPRIRRRGTFTVDSEDIDMCMRTLEKMVDQNLNNLASGTTEEPNISRDNEELKRKVLGADFQKKIDTFLNDI
ncbi:merozoite surface protein 2 isoform X1 [Octopus bimaculoides]|uniref:Uncharacterized protein n=1 Tax=Octopus bimaculoides TaxID=37653 RepID=A0A0L8FHM8_OCTBM|nr:merozoite surface protein 2 isoform X1 [Octopus bimaculoides]XP_014789740.1 merozoite surface protein 2 isoform X1 [Octopus bimaculoides]|eukprot:XP_014789739.1 PREDICTED: merozoite surface antigen 2, allelic form 2-like isoform X1 [Octopus bimaculoides]